MNNHDSSVMNDNWPGLNNNSDSNGNIDIGRCEGFCAAKNQFEGWINACAKKTVTPLKIFVDIPGKKKLKKIVNHDLIIAECQCSMISACSSYWNWNSKCLTRVPILVKKIPNLVYLEKLIVWESFVIKMTYLVFYIYCCMFAFPLNSTTNCAVRHENFKTFK